MKRINAFALVLLALFISVATVQSAQGQQATGDNKDRRIGIGPDVSVYLPLSAKARDRFGGSWFSIGIGFSKLRDRPNQSELQPWFNFIYEKSGTSHACLIPLGAEYRHNFASSGAITPFAGAGLAYYLTDLRSDGDNVHSGFRSAVGVEAVGGAYFGKAVYAQGRIHVVTPVKGFNLSGFEISAGVRF